ncbi:MAG: AAA family ATPase [Gemmatimonadetes bacterium]|nr:AAA family ATPase [Gemmatimonadota bacterium]
MAAAGFDQVERWIGSQPSSVLGPTWGKRVACIFAFQLQICREFPAVVLTGPRQSGKTTLLKHLFADGYVYVSLEPTDIRASAAEDPRSFLARFPPPVIYDEVQFAPGLLPYIKELIDEDRGRAGQFLLSGSQNLLLNRRITESLPGRAAILHLLPMSGRETAGKGDAPLVWEKKSGTGSGQPLSPRDLWQRFLRGSYPELVANPQRDLHLWHSSARP